MSRRREIDRREFPATTGMATAAVASGRMPLHCGSVEQPNLLFVITDQQYLGTISAGGREHVSTPAMDRLVRVGMSFRLSYSASPVCCPARGSLMTGRTPTETGVYANGRRLRRGIPNVGEWFSAHSDYETVYVGKWDLPKTYSFDVPGFEVLHTGIGGQVAMDRVVDSMPVSGLDVVPTLCDLSRSTAHADVVARLKASARAWEKPLEVVPDLPYGDAWWRTS